MLRSFGLFLALNLLAGICFCQEKSSLTGTVWIKREVYALPGNTRVEDSLYTRYTFKKKNAYISFNPAWDDRMFDWSLDGDQLTIGPVQYTIEKWTDSTMVISQPGFRRFVLDNEEWLNLRSPSPPLLGTFKNEPLYGTTKVITPRYKKGGLDHVLQHDLDDYNIRKAITFEMTFIVGTDGSIDSIKVTHGIVQGFDAELVSRIRKTSKDWMPANNQGRPIQSQMVYTIRFLDSIVR